MTTAFMHPDWDAIYLTCFGVGLVLSVVSFLGGFLHLHAAAPKVGGHAPILRNVAAHGSGQHVSRVNGFTIVAFLCWFGGTGYLLTHGHIFTWAVVMLFAGLSGTAGAGLVFWFFSRVLLAREHPLEPADTPIIGVLGRLSAPVPRGGIGEMLYSQNGARRSMPVAAEDGAAIARNAEVVVLRYERGVAYVRRWDEMQQVLLGDEPAAHGNDWNVE